MFHAAKPPLPSIPATLSEYISIQFVLPLCRHRGADGTTKPIEQVKTGDYVLARNQQSGALEQKRVSAAIGRKAPVLVTIALEDVKTGQTESYTSTPDHPFYVEGKGWLTAGTLTKGTAIATRDGQALIVKTVVWQRDEEKGFSVYNMTVEDDHDYLAGALQGGVWVHNACFEKHHIFPDELKDWFRSRDVDHNLYTVKILRSLHQAIHDGVRGGRYSQEWRDFISQNPNADEHDIIEQGAKMIEDYGLGQYPIVRY